ncbi:hypothetical protein AB0F68_19220 [Micromonospora sp. NPDC023966]|uniref:hypothetical protein n=1 Tax=Micromonospora sp. NPDC023966 TaxID=3154699 RepID=UPI0033F13119
MGVWPFRIALVAGAALALLGSGLPGAAAAASAADPAASNAPAGMHQFVVSIGEVRASVRTNWVRLATYTFTDTNEVVESHWHWSQRDRVTRSSTGVTAANCAARNCVVKTSNGFQNTAAPNTLHGTYTVDGPLLRVTWDGTTGWEEWTVSEPIPGKLARLAYVGNSFGATNGWGYGSNASLGTQAGIAQIAAADWSAMLHYYDIWQTDSSGTPYVTDGGGDPFWNRDWNPCSSGRCLGGTTTKNQYYLSRANTTSTDRRDTLWYWRTANADARGEYCYTGNSHVVPMMEIIDSDEVLHGWVGVEASINQSVPAQGTSADDIGLFRISDV